MPESFLGSFAAAICFIASSLTEPVEAGGAVVAIWSIEYTGRGFGGVEI
jgi:hypothetical protein